MNAHLIIWLACVIIAGLSLGEGATQMEMRRWAMAALLAAG